MRIAGITRRSGCPHWAAFTLIELLLSITILSVVLVTTTMLLDSSLRQLRIAEARLGQFREAQAAFEAMTRRLAGCDISPSYDYEYENQNRDTVPIGYALQSDLHFVTGPVQGAPQALLDSHVYTGHAIFFHGTYGFTEEASWKGFGNLLNSWGYFVEFGDEASSRASFLNGLPAKRRFRLKELQVPAEQLRTYAAKLSSETSKDRIFSWFRESITAPAQTHTIAENIVALVIMPLVPAGSKDASGATMDAHGLAPSYYYDTRNYQHAKTPQAAATRHRLPPLLRVSLVALDEVSAQRLEDLHGSTKPPLGVDNLFREASKYDEDLHTLESTLQDRKLNYRVFNTTIRLRNARWTGTY